MASRRLKNGSLRSKQQTPLQLADLDGWTDTPDMPARLPAARCPEEEDLCSSTETSTADRSAELLDEPFGNWSSFLQARSARSEARSSSPELSSRNAQLHEAAASGNVVACRYLLAEGANLGAKDKNGAAALHFAARAGHLAACKFLLGAGARISARDLAGTTALQLAAQNQHFKVCKLLRERAAALAEERTANPVAQSDRPRSAEKDESSRTSSRGPRVAKGGLDYKSFAEALAAAGFSQPATDGCVVDSDDQPTFRRAGAQLAPVGAESEPLEEWRLEINTDLDELECGRASALANKDRSPAHVFPAEVRPPKGLFCFRR